MILPDIIGPRGNMSSICQLDLTILRASGSLHTGVTSTRNLHRGYYTREREVWEEGEREGERERGREREREERERERENFI